MMSHSAEWERYALEGANALIGLIVAALAIALIAAAIRRRGRDG